MGCNLAPHLGLRCGAASLPDTATSEPEIRADDKLPSDVTSDGRIRAPKLDVAAAEIHAVPLDERAIRFCAWAHDQPLVPSVDAISARYFVEPERAAAWRRVLVFAYTGARDE